MDASEALRMAAPQLGASLSLPPNPRPGELYGEFTWLGRTAAWVTGDLGHYVMVPLPLPFGFSYGSSDIEPDGDTVWIQGLPVHPYEDTPYPIDEIRSGPLHDWLASLELTAQDRLAVLEDSAIGLDLTAIDPETDRRRIVRYLDSLSDLEPFVVQGSPEPPSPTPVEIDPRLVRSLERFSDSITSDDADREELLARAPEQVLRAIVDEVRPLLPDIDAALDRLAEQGALDAAQQDLESDLHSLAQLAIEAEQMLTARR